VACGLTPHRTGPATRAGELEIVRHLKSSVELMKDAARGPKWEWARATLWKVVLVVAPVVLVLAGEVWTESVLTRRAHEMGLSRWGLIATTSPYPEERVTYRPEGLRAQRVAFTVPVTLVVALVLSSGVVSTVISRRTRASWLNILGVWLVVVACLAAYLTWNWWRLFEALGLFI